MEIQYRTTRRDAWRCNLHLLAHRPSTWLNLFLPAVLGTWFLYWLSPSLQLSVLMFLYWHSSRWWVLPSVFLANLLVQVLTTFTGTRSRINKAYPEGENRPMTTTTLTPHALCDCGRKLQGDQIIVIPVQIPWTAIVSIKWHESALYFHRKRGVNFIPHSAFENPSQAQQFLDLAQSYWRSARTGVEAPTPQDVWPPAPRPGA